MRWRALSWLFGMSVMAALAQAPTEQKPQFEVASVRLSTADSGPAGIKRSQEQFLASGLSLPFLIRWAYDLDEDRLIGVLNGLDAAKFDIVAKIPQDEKLIPGVTLRLMMQDLLAERFRLAVHREARELLSYALTTDEGGPKIHFVDPAKPTGMNPFDMTDAGRIVGTGVTTEMLAKVLADQLKRPVEDATGIKKPFDFVLEWQPDTVTNPDESIDGGSGRASIFTALKEQLGFRLDARKSAVEVIVIDHVEKMPSEN